MSARIRLQRHGKKGQPFYHIVIADTRAPRDGKFIEKIGTYNPVTDPAQVRVDFDKALMWIQRGAQPTDTVRNIFSKEGILLKNHLMTGVRKGALTEEQAEVKFQAWINERDAKLANSAKTASEKQRVARKEALEAETKVKEARAEAIAQKRAAAAAAEAAETAAEAENAEAPAETEAPAEA